MGLATVTVLCGAAMVLAPGAAAAATTPAPPSVVASSAALALTIDSNGWIHYTNTLVGSLGLVNVRTTTITGTQQSDNSCAFPATSVASGTGDTYSEETAFNPRTCQDTVVTGTLTAAGQAKLNATEPQTVESDSAPDSTALPAATTAANRSYRAFEKVSYVDPADITITSLTNNLHWITNGRRISEANAVAVSYKFHYDNWKTSKITWKWSGFPSNPSFTKAQASQTFYNSDFEKIIVAILGPAGYAACGFNSHPATFFLSPFVEGHPNGSYNVGHANHVKGGCSDLVHFRENHGRGRSS